MRSGSPAADSLHHFSPAKRKRSLSDPTVTPFAPRLRTDLIESSLYEEDQAFGSESPRSYVADRLSSLKLQGPESITEFKGTAWSRDDIDDAQDYKKAKLTRLQEEVVEDSDTGQDSEDDTAKAVEDQGRGMTTGSPRRQQRQRSNSPLSHKSSLVERQASGPVKSPNLAGAVTHQPELHTRAPARSMAIVSIPMERSSSLPTPEKKKANAILDNIFVAAPGPVTPPKNPPKRSVEDTNHEASDAVLDPDDDGTGINGIGFKPTPAIAWARTQKRKQQIQDWRTRENKEARQKRSERRNRAAAVLSTTDDAMNGTGDSRRSVRFA